MYYYMCYVCTISINVIIKVILLPSSSSETRIKSENLLNKRMPVSQMGPLLCVTAVDN